MKAKILLFLSLAFFSAKTYAQNWVTDSVLMGPGYGNDVFYSLKNGSQKVTSNTNWQLGFQMTLPGPYGNVSLIANEVQGQVSVYSLHLSATAKFASLTAADTIGKLSMPLHNSDTSWNFGAFNNNRNPTNQFDYGWGIYSLSTHNVTGDSLYLVMVNQTAYKVWVKSYISNPVDSIKWVVRIAKFDNSIDYVMNINRGTVASGHTDKLFYYLDIANQILLDREPSRYTWDILFTRYIENIPVGGGMVMPYPVMGVLNNFGVTSSVEHGDTLTAHFNNYPLVQRLDEIGSMWKVFNMNTFTYNVDYAAIYNIKTVNTNEYYQMRFINFTGGVGDVVFQKRLIAPTSIANITNNALTAWYVSPNPASDNANIMIDAPETLNGVQITITDMAGRLVYNSSININKGVNTFNINTANMVSGLYVINVQGMGWHAGRRLSVIHS